MDRNGTHILNLRGGTPGCREEGLLQRSPHCGGPSVEVTNRRYPLPGVGAPHPQEKHGLQVHCGWGCLAAMPWGAQRSFPLPRPLSRPGQGAPDPGSGPPCPAGPQPGVPLPPTEGCLGTPPPACSGQRLGSTLGGGALAPGDPEDRQGLGRRPGTGSRVDVGTPRHSCPPSGPWPGRWGGWASGLVPCSRGHPWACAGHDTLPLCANSYTCLGAQGAGPADPSTAPPGRCGPSRQACSRRC